MILVACGSAKAMAPTPPRDLYVGSVFVAASAWAESTGEPWAIVSAKHGALDPYGPPLEPYDFTIDDVTDIDAWARSIAAVIGNGPHTSVMGKAYDRPLADVGVQLTNPLGGMRFGLRLQWFKRHTTNRNQLDLTID